jgi:uncharacterized protein YndB with AHSA1/START domain
MTVTSVENDTEALTLTLIADFEASVENVWQLWANPRQLESWWGPPGYPATMDKHELSPGGDVAYYMTSPEGEKHHGWWKITKVNPPNSLEFLDGFADKNGVPNSDLPNMTIKMRLFENSGGTRMEMQTLFASREHLEQMIEMGMQEGLTQSVAQMEGLLAS